MIETKFKHTDIGLVPVDWEVKKLSDITNVVTGGTPRTDNSSFWGGNIRWMNSGELNLKFVYDVEGRITEDGYNHSSTQKIPTKCVLIGLAGQGKTRGTAAFNLVPLCINQSIGAIIPNKDFDPLYMYYQIDNRYQELRMLSSGDGGRGGLNKQILFNLNIVLPSMQEQQRIASALMNIDALISNLDKLIAKKQAIKKGAMQELLTGKKRLPGFKGEWKEIELGDVSDIKTGSSNAQDADPNGKYPFFIRSEKVERSNKYVFDCEAILIPGEGRIGEIFHYIKGKFDCHQRVYKISNFKEVDGKFILFYMRYKFKEHALSQTAKATVDSLRLPTIQSFEMYLPSTLDEQCAIAHVLSTMDSGISLLEQKRDKYRQIKQGMMRDLLTGRIRLTDKDLMERKGYTVGLHDHPFDGAIAAEPTPQ